ncbi:hypothetical protein [Clostridium oryzae]|uniref:YCII-related domain protein n=1 Tax=Clostridium oryzae TaxID=1450648 RepID=A0A1V4IUB7_9CLOT|nr:hypothetical protein [Clostridium oryzae]OPJ63037.1 hypothetical protein CLORY_14030 [Clostridium oryzae]
MNNKQDIYVKINYKNSSRKKLLKQELHTSKGNSNFTKFLYCAGMLNKDGGTMVFRARNLEEADFIANNNPFTNSELYKYEIINSSIQFLA